MTAAGATVLWFGFWGLFVIATPLPANRAPSALHDMVAGMATGEPSWVASLNRFAATVLAHYGTQASMGLATLFAAVAVSVFAPSRFRKPRWSLPSLWRC